MYPAQFTLVGSRQGWPSASIIKSTAMQQRTNESSFGAFRNMRRRHECPPQRFKSTISADCTVHYFFFDAPRILQHSAHMTASLLYGVSKPPSTQFFNFRIAGGCALRTPCHTGGCAPRTPCKLGGCAPQTPCETGGLRPPDPLVI